MRLRLCRGFLHPRHEALKEQNKPMRPAPLITLAALPAAWLSPGPRPNRLILWTMATGPDAAFTKMDWAPVPATPTIEETTAKETR